MFDTISKLVAGINFLILNNRIRGYFPYTKINELIISKLFKSGLVLSYQVKLLNNTAWMIEVHMRYYKNINVLHSIKRISKPGHRIYWTVAMLRKNIFRTQFIDSDYLVSTPRGLLYGKECIMRNISGEVLLKIN